MRDLVSVDGRIEGVDDGVLRGWAWRADGADEIRLAVSVDGGLLATLSAEGRQVPLTGAMTGPSAREFELDLPDDLVETGNRRIAVQILPESVALTADDAFVGTTPDGVWCTTSFEVDVSPPRVEGGLDGTGAEAASAGVSPPRLTALESVWGGEIVGWARSKREPRVEVTATVEGRVVARTRADIPRPDLKRHFYGFRLILPDDLHDGGPHAVAVQVGGREVPIRPRDLWPLVAPRAVDSAPDLRFRCEDDGSGSGGAERALLGRDGWLFATREDRDTRWDKPLKPQAITAFVDRVDEWSSRLREAGIPYVLAFVPARERLEARRRPEGSAASRPGPLAQVLPLVAAGEAVDLLSDLQAAQRTQLVSCRTDPGLNPRGALVVARALCRRANALVQGSPTLDFDVQFTRTPGCRGRFAGRAKVDSTPGGLRGAGAGAIPLDAYGELVELPHPRYVNAVQAQVGPHFGDVSRRSVVLRRPSSVATDQRAVLIAADPPDALGLWLAEAYGQVTVISDLAVPTDEVELERPDVVFHVVDEADIRLLV